MVRCLTLSVLLFSLFTATLCGQNAKEFKEYKTDPTRFDGAVKRYEAKDKKQAPPKGAIVVIGSSSISGWHSTIKKDLAPLTIIPRGFGGSNMHDALHYVDRLVTVYKPRAVVLYEGDNDVASSVSAKTIRKGFRAFVKRIHKKLPKCRVYFLSIKPSVARLKLWPKMEDANKLIARDCRAKRLLTYIDISKGMLDKKGKPKTDIFKKDNLHMNRAGYEIWRDAVRPILIKKEGAHEPQKAKK